MSDTKTLTWKMRFQGVDGLTPELKAIREQTKTLGREMAQMQKHKKQFAEFSALRRNLKQATGDMDEARREAAELGRALSQTQNPTKKMSLEFERARRRVRELKTEQQANIQKLAQTGRALKDAGYDTTKFRKEQLRLRSAMSSSGAELKKQRGELDRLGRSYRKAKTAKKEFNDARARAADTAVVGAAGVAVGQQTLRGAFNVLGSIRNQEANIGRVRSLGQSEEQINIKRDIFDKIADEFAYMETSDLFAADYDVSSALSNLNAETQGYFTAYSAVLARATDANASEITALATTSHGLFKSANDGLSDIEWMDKFATGIAGAVKGYKTTGPKMERAIKSAGAIPAAMGFTMDEYFNMLGAAQKTMEKGEAGTGFKSYARNLVKAQEAFDDQGLGIDVIGADGLRLEIADVIEQINDVYGQDWDGFEISGIAKNFGDAEAINFLISQKNALDAMAAGQSTIGQYRDQGMGSVKGMAFDMDNNGDAEIQKMIEDLRAAKRALGYSLLPVFTDLAPIIKSVTQGFAKFVESHPKVFKVIGIGVIAFGALAAVMGGITLALASMLGPIAVVKFAMGTLGLKGLGVGKAFMWMGRSAIMLGAKALPIAAAGMRALTVAMMANPIGLIIAGVVALAAGAYLIFKNWKPISAWFGRMWDGIKARMGKAWGYIKALLSWSPIGIIIRMWRGLRGATGDEADGAHERVRAAWALIKAILSWSPIGLVKRAFDGMSGIIGGSMDEGSNRALGAMKRMRAGMGNTLAAAKQFRAGLGQSLDANGKLRKAGAGVLAMAAMGVPGLTHAIPGPASLSGSQSTVTHGDTRYEINLHQQPGEDGDALLKRLMVMLDERERKRDRKARTQYSDPED